MDTENAHHKDSKGVKIRKTPAAIIGLGVISGTVYLFNFKLLSLVPDNLQTTDIQFYVFMNLFLSVIYLIAVLLVYRCKSISGSSFSLIGIIIFLAIVFRLFLVPAHPAVLSNDMYRYIWDGRVQQRGINPYNYPPAAEELKTLREDKIFPNINRKDSPTIYPAGAQVLFRIFYALAGDSVSGYKGFMAFFDVMSLLLLTALLKKYGFDPSRVIIYAWNPLVIFEISYSGHLEGLVVFFILAAFYFTTAQKKIPGFIFLAFSSAIKLYPALLFAAFLNRGSRIKGILTFCITFLLLYLPFISAGGKLSGFLPVYLQNPYESFNLGLKKFVMDLIPDLDYYILSRLFVILVLIAGLVVFLREKKGIQTIHHAYILAGLLIILMPASLHPWYVILIVPFLAFYPNFAWMIFTVTVSLSYLKYVSPQGIMPSWVLMAEYLPLFVLLAAGFLFKRMSVHGFRVQRFRGSGFYRFRIDIAAKSTKI